MRCRRAHEGEQASTPRSGSVEESVEGVADFAEVRRGLGFQGFRVSGLALLICAGLRVLGFRV